MARINISISDDLKTRMDALEAAINWSNVAGHAFERELLRMDTLQNVEDMDDAVIRLRASKELTMISPIENAENRGRQWAMEAADYLQLEAMSKVEWLWADEGEALWNGVGRIVTSDHSSELLDDVDSHNFHAFWKDWLEVEEPDGEIIKAFGKSAVEVWKMVSPKI